MSDDALTFSGSNIHLRAERDIVLGSVISTQGQVSIVTSLGSILDGGDTLPEIITLAAHLSVAPLVQLVTWRFSLAPCCPATLMPDPLALLDMHADMVVRGLRQE